MPQLAHVFYHVLNHNFLQSTTLAQYEYRSRQGHDTPWIKRRESDYKNQFQKRLPFIVVTLAVVKILCFIYLGKTNYYNRCELRCW